MSVAARVSVIGDAVNIAARVEAATRKTGDTVRATMLNRRPSRSPLQPVPR
jgi:class 3 adenylate cyclase